MGNEEAIKDAYTHFTDEGYGGSIADFSTLISTNDEALSDAGANIELLGDGASGTVNTGNLNSGRNYDIECGSGTGNQYQVWYNPSHADMNTANHATETGTSYIWVCNAGTGNADAQNATSAKLRICVEYIGQN